MISQIQQAGYSADCNWSSVPSYVQIENCHELVQSRDGRIFMSCDHPANNVIIFSPVGKFLGCWTLGYDGCHGLTLFERGEEEYLLITQTGVTEVDGVVNKGLGEVVKTTLDGKVLQTFLNPFELGLYHDSLTYNPTETCVAANGDIYIADGYGASFVHCLDADGTYRFSFGGADRAPGDASLINPHGVAIDPRFKGDNGEPLLVVSSRKQSRLKHFTSDGQFVSSTHLPGAYPCRAVIRDDYLYCGVCWSGPVVSHDDLTNYASRHDASGFVLVLDKKGAIVQAVGAKAPVYEKGVLQPLVVSESSPFAHVHDVLPVTDNTWIISQWRGEQTLPYKIEIRS